MAVITCRRESPRVCYTHAPMLHLLGVLLPFISGCAGILLIYASLSYETEDGKIQSLLEEWWIRIDDLRQKVISFHVAFMRVLASLISTHHEQG